MIIRLVLSIALLVHCLTCIYIFIGFRSYSDLDLQEPWLYQYYTDWFVYQPGLSSTLNEQFVGFV